MRMTSKGQVTIPKEIRDILGVKPGGDVGFAHEDGKVVLFARNPEDQPSVFRRNLERAQALARKAKRIPMTDKELMELTRGPFNDLDAG
jgi:AbrB family looped-hinge helix DNA binding protein